MRLLAIFAATMLTTATALAQDLHQEIEIDRDIEPVEHEVNKLNITPAIELPPLAPVKLSLSSRAVSTTVSPLIPFLEPAAYADSLYVTPYRGYFVGGLSPVPISLALSAGYRLVDTDRVRLSVWGQFDSQNYKKNLYWKEESRYWRDNTLTAGADFRWSIGRKSLLKVALDYTFDRYKEIYRTPMLSEWQESVIEANPRYYQTINLFNAEANFSSHIGGLDYNTTFRFNHTGARRGASPRSLSFNDITGFGDSYPAVRQTTVDLKGTATLATAETSYLKLDLGASVLHSSAGAGVYKNSDITAPVGVIDYGDRNRGLITITPGFLLDSDNFKASVGARVQFSVNAGRVFDITPDVNLGWIPSSIFSIDARLTGGVETNALDRLYGICPFFNPSTVYGFSRVPLDGLGRVTIGPFQGAYLELSAGYSMAKHWLMPLFEPFGYSSTVIYTPGKVNGWRFGAAIGYNWRERVVARVEYMHAPGSDSPDKGYYLWRDRARHQLSASLKVKMIERLSLKGEFKLRAGRRFIDRYEYVDASTATTVTSTTVRRLSNVACLNLGANLDCSDRLNLFIKGENLLNRTTYDIALHPDAAIAIYFGASYLF